MRPNISMQVHGDLPRSFKFGQMTVVLGFKASAPRPSSGKMTLTLRDAWRTG
jgi:hypothetical protein